MSDAGNSRRAPPSPLVFSPEAVLPPIPPPLNKHANTSHGSGTNTVSMPFVRRHVTRRLKAAKTECDKELQRVTNNITAFFEERLRENDHERETERDYRERERDRDSQLGDMEHLRETFSEGRPPSQALSIADDASSDGGYEAEFESNRNAAQRASPPAETHKPPSLTHWSSSPGLNTASLSPSALKRQNTLPWDKTLSQTASSSTTSVVALTSGIASAMDAASPPRKQPNNNNPPPSWANNQNVPNRRLSRTIHIPNRTTRSSNSSRSNSRSRSPLPPPTNHSSFSEVYNSGPTQSTNNRHSRIHVDDPIDPIMSALYDIIGVATDITDMSMTQLTSQPKVCETLVQRIQNIGKAWDDHPDWHGRNWYVQVLLAVASLSRVVEWWEAEKSFWNFDDNDDEQDEPLTFVMKPPEEPAITPAPTPTFEALDALSSSGASLALTSDDENKLRLHRPVSHGRRSRDEMTKNLSAAITKAAEESSPVGGNKTNESARVLATERLRLQAETAQNQNIVMELSLDGDHFIWVNHAWRGVVGTESDGLSGTRISRMLAPSDWNVFRDATQQLQDDDSHTVEVSFKLQVEPEDDRDASCGTLYQQMEGKGMLMIDREDGQPSHTMWVVKPISSPRYERPSPSIALEGGEIGDEPATGEADTSFADRSGSMEPVTPFPFSLPISTELLLCRICESQIPQWYFEKHSETCVEVHRLEAEIAECNESISELRSTIRDLCAAVDISSGIAPEYRGMPLMSPSSSPGSSSPLHLFRVNKLQRMGVKRMQRRLLEQLEEVLSVASEVAVPSLKEEEAKEPIERQRLLSPGSERKMSQVRNWGKPSTQDPALGQLVDDAERVMRQKIDNVVRMQNTIRYSEKIWHEWQERVEDELDREGSESSSDSGDDTGDRQPKDAEDDRASFNSEYVLATGLSSEPTPMASSPSLNTTANASNLLPPVSAPLSTAVSPAPFVFSPPPPLWPTGPAPAPWQVVSKLPTRSSTPSSISSPLALAAPIVASRDETPPPMNLNDGPSTGALTIRTQRSAGNLLEPPTSPMLSPRDGVTTSRRGHRRHSTAANILLGSGAGTPLSPRQPSAAPLSRANPTSIKDFEIIKPISKGAFGSVFLAKKRATGDYFAIKVLKKADMIAKNQITNVKAERMILMKQAESPFVAKLYFTFQSKENLYLVMEYLNGGDCAALIKTLGCLPEEWTKNYVAEVTLGLEYLHQQGVVHRDLKPDNLLIDQHGHLKLTDFGLSRIGLLGRQTRESQVNLRPRPSHGSRSRPPSMDSAYLSSPLLSADVLAGGSYFNQRVHPVPGLGASPHPYPTDDVSESSGSESLSGFPRRGGNKSNESPLQSFATELTNDLRSHSGLGTPPGEGKFVGTPDYLAPETILGLRGDDATVDWWALGVITYEFLYGIPPFHAETPEKVFENILSGHIDWHEDWDEFSDDARDFMHQLMTLNTNERLGANGADEVKSHPWFQGIDWDNVTASEAAFIPQVTDPESTDYFDPRGAIPQLFQEEDHIALGGASQSAEESPRLATSMPPPAHIPDRDGPSSAKDDFGSFSFKNLPVLKQANDDVIRKLKTDQMVPMGHTLSEPAPFHSRKRSLSQRLKKQPPSVNTSGLDSKPNMTGPPSPATSTSSIASSPSRTSMPSLTQASANNHARKPSEYGAVERFKLNHLDGVERRNSMPSRLRTASVSSAGEGSGSEQNWASHGSQFDASTTPPSSVHSIDLRKGPDPNDRAVTCLLAEDNPITAKIIETLLIRLGCRCVVVADGSEAISVAMGDIKFDCILMDLYMPVLDGEGAARYIKSTNSKNTSTPIIAISAYSGAENSEVGGIFAASLAKPLQKADILSVMRQLGFKTSSVPGGPGATKLTATRVVS